jgi:SSS family transporter
LPKLFAALALIVTTQRLRPFDLALVALYLVAITLFGLRFREKKGAAKQDRSLKSYFLANNTIPWWAIALSIVSAETSTLTIISIPGVAFAGDFGFLQVVLGYMLGRIVVTVLFLPRYFAGEMLTAYQLIDRRFGNVLHKTTAGLFLLTRAAAEGVRVFAVSIVVGIAIGTRDILSIAIISALTLLYTFEGGMAAVIWTDVVQMAIYIGGTVVAIATLGTHVNGGWTTIHHVAASAGKFHIFDFAFNLTTTYTFWAGVLGGTFLTMASHGTDQLMVQRMLAARSLRESRLALLSSGVVIFIQFTLFLLIGVGLYVFYGQHPGTFFRTNDYIFPTFIVRAMPIGIAGLLVAAILAAAMSNLSAALNSLSSTTVVDFYMHLRPNADDRERNLISKSSTVLWALVLFAIAVYAVKVGGKGHVVEIGLSIASVAYGCLLGVFLLGTLTKFATEIGTAIGMVCGFALNLWLWQGVFPVHLGPITIPHIAWTWYVLIGALVTFTIGSLASLIFRKQSTRRIATAAILLVILSAAKDPCILHAQATTPAAAPPYDFTPVTTLLTEATTAHHPPGAVVIVGHNGHIVYDHVFGERKLAGEPGPLPGPDGKPDLAPEPMTEDTIFDMASLTKDLATATAIMQLYEQGKIASFDDPIIKYLPNFADAPGDSTPSSANGATTAQPGAQPQVGAYKEGQRAEGPTQNAHPFDKSKVTIRMLLTHTSGEGPDVILKDPWGLAAPDKAEGFKRALAMPLKNEPASIFLYSDINFILLGDLVETLSGQPEDEYVQQHIFKPLGMTDTRYLPIAKACGPDLIVVGAAITLDARHPKGAAADFTCRLGSWYPDGVLPRTAPTTHDDEGNATTNPHFDLLTRGTVHDPTTRRMGGVAGHAGVFSTAHDISLYASALLEKLLHNTGPFPLKQSTLQLMTQPEQPGHNPSQIPAANAAQAAAIKAGEQGTLPGLAPHYPAIKGQDLRGYGWDIDTAFSKPRGMIFPIGSFGHTGFTGTTLWMDPTSDTYVVLLSNAVHPRGNTPISNLRGQVATAAAQALHLYANAAASRYPEASASGLIGQAREGLQPLGYALPNSGKTLTGIDVLEQSHAAALTTLAHSHNNHLTLGLLTNQNGLDSHGHRTIDYLYQLRTENLQLTTLFAAEHGLTGTQDTTAIGPEVDPTTHLTVTGLYGVGAASRHPTHDQLKDLDAVVIDLQDAAGVHFWTYESVLGYFLEAASTEKTQYHHTLEIIVLDRPNPVGGLAVQGPVSDPGRESYINYMPLPVRHGMTFGELARYIVGTKHLETTLTVVPMQHWQRSMFYADTGLPWVNPSPNLRSPEAALRYPALGLIEYNNISVGRGTDHPFSFFGAGIPPTKPSTSTATGGLADAGSPTTTGAPGSSGTRVSTPAPTAWFKATEVANYLTARNIPGVTFTPTAETIAEDANHYPFHGQTIEAVRVTLTDPKQTDTPELGIEILAALHHLYPTQFNLPRAMPLVCNQATMDALTRGDDPKTIATTWQPALDQFKSTRTPYLIYR